MTIEQVLRDILQERGMSALRNGETLIGLFQDFSRNQLGPQANALRVFVSCQGNTRILNLQNAPLQEQQVQLHRLVQEMTTQHNMREETAVEVCNAFWRAVYQKDSPVMWESVAPTPRETPDELFQRGCACLQQDKPGKEEEAVKWFRKAAELGHAEAQWYLGYRLMDGIGTPVDEVEGLSWFHRAAAGGKIEAHNHIGYSYYYGKGVEQDHAQAAYWYRKGADLGDPCAMNNLSLLYETGCGVEQNLEQALFWCRKAAAQGDKSAAERIPEIEKKLEKEDRKPVPDPVPTPPAPKPMSRWHKLRLLFLLIVFILVLFLQLSELFGSNSKRTRSDLKPYGLEDSIEDMLLAGTEEIYTYPDGTWMEFYYDDAGQEIYRVYVNTENDIENLFEARYDDSGRLVYHQIFDGAGNLLRSDSYDFHSSEDTAQRRVTFGDGSGFQGISTFDENGYETFTVIHADGTQTVSKFEDGGVLTYRRRLDAEGNGPDVIYGDDPVNFDIYEWENVPKVYGPWQTAIGWNNGNGYTYSYVQGLCGGALKEYTVSGSDAVFVETYDPKGNLLENVYYVDAQMSELGSHEVYNYDAQGNYTGSTLTFYHSDGSYWISTYDENGIELTMENHYINAEGVKVVSYERYETELDDQGREIRVQTFDGKSGRLISIDETEYNSQGDVHQETRTYFYEDGGYSISVRDGEGKYLKDSRYYPSGKIEYATDFNADGQRTKWTRYYESGQIDSVEEYNDQGEHAKRTDYYENGQIESLTEYSDQGKTVKSTDYYENGKIQSVYAYNEAGDIIKSTSYDENGNVRYSSGYQYEYDADGNIIKEIKLDEQGSITGWETVEYGADGNMEKTTNYDASGKLEYWTDYTYDDEGRFVDSQVHYPD